MSEHLTFLVCVLIHFVRPGRGIEASFRIIGGTSGNAYALEGTGFRPRD